MNTETKTPSIRLPVCSVCKQWLVLVSQVYISDAFGPGNHCMNCYYYCEHCNGKVKEDYRTKVERK